MNAALAIQRTLAAAVVAVTASSLVRAQADPEWLLMWKEAQTHRPAELTSVGRLAPPSEPGTRLVVHGRVFDPDGRTPADGVVVFAYQTDRDGIYFGPGKPGDPWRLRAWAKTTPDGRFELRTIRPGPYPGRNSPAHIHLFVETRRFGRQWTPSLRFADDPLLSAEDRAQSAAAGRFGGVCVVRLDGSIAHVDFVVKLKPIPDF
jgi:protocatechuate 3,4-dioxygenase beta subunit